MNQTLIAIIAGLESDPTISALMPGKGTAGQPGYVPRGPYFEMAQVGTPVPYCILKQIPGKEDIEGFNDDAPIKNTRFKLTVYAYTVATAHSIGELISEKYRYTSIVLASGINLMVRREHLPVTFTSDYKDGTGRTLYGSVTTFRSLSC